MLEFRGEAVVTILSGHASAHVASSPRLAAHVILAMALKTTPAALLGDSYVAAAYPIPVSDLCNQKNVSDSP